MQNFERHPDLAVWIERLANLGVPGWSMADWQEFTDALNASLGDPAQRQPKPAAWGRMIDGEAVTVSRIRNGANDEPLYASPHAQGLPDAAKMWREAAEAKDKRINELEAMLFLSDADEDKDKRINELEAMLERATLSPTQRAPSAVPLQDHILDQKRRYQTVSLSLDQSDLVLTLIEKIVDDEIRAALTSKKCGEK